MIGFGLAGLGRISSAHLDGLLAAQGHARLVAVCDLDRSLADQVAAEYGARAYCDVASMVRDAEVDAVDLLLPHMLHYPAAAEALAAGKHVLVEKPMAPSAASCSELISLAATQGACLSVAENTRFVEGYIATERILRSGRLGAVRLVRTFIGGSSVILREPNCWKSRVRDAIGGALFDAGPHSFYLVKWLFGDIARLRASRNRLVATSEVEDHGLVSGQMACGALFTSEFTFTAEVPWSERLEVYCSEGALILDQLNDPPLRLFRGRTDLVGEACNEVRFDPAGWKRRSIARGVTAYAMSVARDAQPPVDPNDAAYAIRVVEAAYASIEADGRSIEV